VLLAIVIVGGYFVLASYAESIGFGVQHADKWAGSAALGGPLIVLAGPSSQGGFGSKWFQDLMNILLIIDVSAVGIGASVAASRLIFSLGRDRRIPGVFASVSKRYGTPTVAILTIIGLSIIEIAWVRLGHGVLTRDIPGVPPNVAQFSEYLPVFSWLAAFGSLCLAVIYAAVSLAAIRGLLGKANPVLLTISIVLAVAITGLAIYSQVYKVPAPSNTVPAAFLIWWGVGILFLIILMATKRFRVSAQGAGALDAHTEQLEQVHPEF
jgi:amino acid transporter